MQFRPALFWDVDPKKIDVRKRGRYVIERILSFGREGDIHWMLRTYPKRSILAVARASRALDPKSRNFWLTFLKGKHASRRAR